MRTGSEESFPQLPRSSNFFSILAGIELQDIAPRELVARIDECVFDTVSSHLGNDHLALVTLAYELDLGALKDFTLSKSRQAVTTITRGAEVNGFSLECFNLVSLVKGVLIPRGELEEATVVSRWMLDRAAEASGLRATYLRFFGGRLEFMTAEAQKNTEAMASSLLRQFQLVRQWPLFPRVTKIDQLEVIIAQLKSLGEPYSELVSDACSSFNHKLHRYEVASKRAGILFEEYLFEGDEASEFESDSSGDFEADSGVDDEDSDEDSDPHYEMDLQEDFADELPKEWPAVNDVMDCETAFEWATAPAETTELAPRSFDMDDLLQTDNVGEV